MASKAAIADRAFARAPETWSSFPVIPAFTGRSSVGGLKVNEVITGHASELGLSHCDGKVEYLVSGDARIVVADSPGTPDESRLMYGGVHCGKQVIRNWYVAQGLEIPVQRLIADGIPRSQWPRPAPLPPGFMPVMSDMYRSLSEAWTGERIWNAPDLRTATQAARRLTSH